jgi:hypothetical protein
VAGWYDNPIPTWFLAPIDCSKIPTLTKQGDVMGNKNIFRIWKFFGQQEFHLARVKIRRESENLEENINSKRVLVSTNS